MYFVNGMNVHGGGDKNCFLFGIATDCKANAKRQNCGKNQDNDYQSILAE